MSLSPGTFAATMFIQQSKPFVSASHQPRKADVTLLRMMIVNSA
jgi:hypothetical protein